MTVAISRRIKEKGALIERPFFLFQGGPAAAGEYLFGLVPFPSAMLSLHESDNAPAVRTLP